jgi:predicted MPP superfamily phosphohydrolase
MTLTLGILTAAALGHYSLLVRILNGSHGLGIRSRWIEPVSAVLMVAVGLASLAGLIVLAGLPPEQWPAPVWPYLGACLLVSLVGLPAITAARLLRRRPSGIVGPLRELAIEPPQAGLASWIGDGPRSWILRLPGNESLRPRATEWSITLPGLPRALDGLSVLHLSDLHFARAYRRAFFEAVVDAAAQSEVDLVLLTGDLLDDDACLEWIEPVLGGLRGRLGNYAILGNHDIHHDPGRIAQRLEAAGFRVLDGRWDHLDASGVSLAVGGTWEPWGRPLPPPEPGSPRFRLVLSHSPDTLPRAASWGADLILAGHNHGGQVRLPVAGPILVPSRHGRWFDQGFFRSGRTILHVTPGIGAKHPYRFRCAPEFSRLILRCPVPAPSPRVRRAVSGPAL